MMLSPPISCRLGLLGAPRLLLLLTIGTCVAATNREHQSSKLENNNSECICRLWEKPDIWKKEATARWMVHSLDWGVISTISTRLESTTPIPFGNVYSFVDGPCHNATGTPYLYGTYMDQSFQDTRQNTMVSLTLSEASLYTKSPACWKNHELEPPKACRITPNLYGDPENPVCARLVMTGRFEALTPGQDEYNFARNAIFQRHPSMADWPEDHDWIVAAIRVQDLWLIDFFGGASILNVTRYFQLELSSSSQQKASTEVEEEELNFT